MSKIRPSITGENIWNDGRRAPFYRCCYDYYSSIHGAALTGLAGMLHHLDSFRLLSSFSYRQRPPSLKRDPLSVGAAQIIASQFNLSNWNIHHHHHRPNRQPTEYQMIPSGFFFFSIKGTMKFSKFFHWTLWTFLMIKDGSIVNRNGKFCI